MSVSGRLYAKLNPLKRNTYMTAKKPRGSNPVWPTNRSNCIMGASRYYYCLMIDAMRLFDEFERTDAIPAQYNESIFDSFNRLAWKDAECIREVLEG